MRPVSALSLVLLVGTGCNQILGFTDPTLDAGVVGDATSADAASVDAGDPVDAAIDAADGVDANVDAGGTPDAAVCDPESTECSGDDLCTCVEGELQCAPCALGCSTVGDAHCVTFIPSNLGSTTADLTVGDDVLVLTVGAIDTDALTVAGLSPASGVTRIHVQGAPAPDIAVFRYRTIEISGTIAVRGGRALALVATESISITGQLVHEGVTNDCPSGSAGGDGVTGGGGGGGGYGTSGAAGGAVASQSTGGSGGGVTGAPELAPLAAGCSGKRGGLGGGGNAGSGGRAGGAIQLVAGDSITVEGTVCASGQGGLAKGGMGGPGGGGSGGSVLLEAPSVVLMPSAAVAANGGGGGSESTGGVSCVLTAGGIGGPQGPSSRAGGDGAFASTSAMPGVNENNCPGTCFSGGGGGGGAGRIRINRADGAVPSGGTSPSATLGTLSTLP